MLIGLVTKNSILIVEYANQLRARGLETGEAVIEAAKIRLRPILMTSFATIFGILPIAIGLGAGAESRRPLGIAVVGGMLFSTFLTLLLVPVVYRTLARFSHVEAPTAEASGGALHPEGRLASSEAGAHRGRAGEPVRFLAASLSFLAESEYRLGRWDDAMVHAELAVSLAETSEELMALIHARAAAARVKRPARTSSMTSSSRARLANSLVGSPNSGSGISTVISMELSFQL